MLTPLDIHNREFNKGIRGYKENEVDQFLDTVISDFEKMIKENKELKQELEELEESISKYKAIEKTLNDTLVVAKKTADDIMQNAQNKAKLTIEEAEIKAKQIISEANDEVKNIYLEHDNTKKQLHIFKTRYKNLLESELESLSKVCDDIIEDL